MERSRAFCNVIKLLVYISLLLKVLFTEGFGLMIKIVAGVFYYCLLRLFETASNAIWQNTSYQQLWEVNIDIGMPDYTLKCHACYAFQFCIQPLLALFGSNKTFLWIFVLCWCTSCAWHCPINEYEWCFVFRFLPLSIHLWHWEPHQPV